MQWPNERSQARWIVQQPASSATVTSLCPFCGRMSWNGCDCPVNWIRWEDDPFIEPIPDPDLTLIEVVRECARRTYRVLVRARRRRLAGWLAPRSRARAPVVPRRSVQRGQPLGLRNYARR